MLKLLITSMIAGLLLFLTTARFPTATTEHTPKTATKNPIDKILGERYLDNGTIRRGNFDALLNIDRKHLFDSSEHYQIRALQKDLFLLKRKKFYLDNRLYSLIVTTKNNSVATVHPFVDLAIQDALVSGNHLFIIQGDYTEIASHWQPTYSIKISCLDRHFRELWNISSISNKGVFFLGYDLRMEDRQLIARFGVQGEGSSTMCVSDYLIGISKQGKINRIYGDGTNLCGPTPHVTVNRLKELFEEH